MDIVKTVAALLLVKKSHAFAPVLVPTMGALHAGHLALIERAKSIAGPNGCVAVSIFVNPIQFNQASDLENYPSTLDQDIALCEEHGVDILFTPEASSLYPNNRSTTVTESSLSSNLCGATREGHFDGVCTVVAKLFNLFTPTDAIFGKKDFQQLAIINRMVRDLNFPVIIHAVETLREKDGLALSSRNLKLSSAARAQAPTIRKSLLLAQSSFVIGETCSSTLINIIRDALMTECPLSTIDYLECVDAESLQPIKNITTRSIIAIATYLGDVRLIDNIELTPFN